ncbi:helix-turn-helix domain-containing protein [Nocardioides speluncae]|uniref:helix-turn-helix domain-containing protein n=1 Tax=Nocardioides speluncae TaxID=2670337 RepID=UPI000D68D68E|nr:helix-turn-helix transcriptional regulator [Nocardioides speluncae]
MSTAEAFARTNEPTGPDETTGERLTVAPQAVEVRRNSGLAAAVGACASAVAIGYLARAAQTGHLLDWLLVLVMGAIGGLHLRAFVDARTPLLVADPHGVRIRLGRTWRGLPWGALAAVEHNPRRGLLRDGRLTLVPHNPQRVLDELDANGRWQTQMSEKLYGAPFAVPLGIGTRVTGVGTDLTEALQSVAGPAAAVVQVLSPDTDESPTRAMPEWLAKPRDPRPALAHAIGAVADRLQRERTDDLDETYVDEPEAPEAEVEAAAEVESAEPAIVASATPAPLREPTAGQRAEVHRSIDERPNTEPEPQPSGKELRRPGSVNLVEETVAWGDRVRPIAQAQAPVEPLVIEDFAVEPADNPVIGPELAAARTRIGLTVDQLAERTRIRPHVIESIEVDDFAPCGGDFYARGHLRTLARVLGADIGPLLAAYDERYADAPINPRRVFEAELATGANGTIRGTRGGPNWSLVVAAVMTLVLAWSIARLLLDEPETMRQESPSIGSQPPAAPAPAGPMKVELTAADGPAHVVVRNGNGRVVAARDLAEGGVVRLQAGAPVTVEVTSGAVQATVAGRDEGLIGGAGRAAKATFRAG